MGLDYMKEPMVSRVRSGSYVAVILKDSASLNITP